MIEAREWRDFAAFLGKTIFDPEFVTLVNSPDSVYWYRAFLEYQAEQKAEAEYKKESLNALIWIGNIVSHSGSMAASFFSNGKFTKNLGQLYTPPNWKQYQDPEELKDRQLKEDEETALSLGGL